MNFSQELRHYHDEIFAAERTEMHFVASLLEDAQLLLDIGCGTGNRTVRLAAPGRRIIGVDFRGDLIARAREAASERGVNYEMLDMLDIDKQFRGMTFDGMVCLGNTLVYLSVENILCLLERAYSLLARGGRLVIQTVNYDRILDNCVCTLPDIDTEHATVKRAYSRASDGLHFRTTLRIKACGRVFNDDIVLFPLRRNTLAGMLAGVGFEVPDWYGCYSGKPLTRDSFIVIAACRK